MQTLKTKTKHNNRNEAKFMNTETVLVSSHFCYYFYTHQAPAPPPPQVLPSPLPPPPPPPPPRRPLHGMVASVQSGVTSLPVCPCPGRKAWRDMKGSHVRIIGLQPTTHHCQYQLLTSCKAHFARRKVSCYVT